VHEIIVKQDFTEQDAKDADLARAEFRKSESTSKVSNVLDMADTYRTVLLCSDHVRAFAHPAVLRQYGYRQMVDFPFVMGNCDYCGIHERCQVFSHESVFKDVWKTKEDRQRELATSVVVRG
jgi:hypothetical protein